MATPTLDLIIDITDPQKQGLVSSLLSGGSSGLAQIFDLESQLVRIQAVKPSATPLSATWDVVDLTSATVECAIGAAQQSVTSGTASLSYNGVTAGLAGIALTAAALQTALTAVINAQSGIGVTVTAVGTLGFLVQGTSNGALQLIADAGSALVPAGSARVWRLVAGTAEVAEQQFIWFLQDPAAYTNAFANDGVLAGSMSGTLVCSTAAMLELFTGTTADIVDSLFFSVRVTLPGQLPQTILRIPVNIARTVINPSSISPVQLPLGEQLYSFLTGLTGGAPLNLDGIGTVQLPLLFIAKFVVGNSYKIYQLQAGAAGAGEVAPADYNAGTNNKKWVSVS